jgi:ribonucleoside-diphosphate reductase alpha chain
MSDKRPSEILAGEELLFPIDRPGQIKENSTTTQEKVNENVRTEKGLRFEHYFSRQDVHPFDNIEWEKREASIIEASGKVIFKQTDVEVPKTWSQIATNVVVSKYFSGHVNSTERENSVKQLVNRVSRTIADWGKKDGYFASDNDAEIFYNELTYLLVHQYASFNSPVWFNVGIEEKPQCSACFINSVSDTMAGILDLAKIEGMLFKYGSGTGTNFSTLRSSKESLSGGGIASGPVSFMKGFDAFAGVIKSGGRTRRAAKMVILNADHPDIEEFINCKANEEKKAWALIDAGYDGGIDGIAYSSIFFQNANHSVRATDEFMEAVDKDDIWTTRAVSNGEPMDTHQARDLMHKIADSTHVCGDPGMQFDTIINDWHTCPNSDRINGSNPCSEYMFIDDTACNLASLNLIKFLAKDGSFLVEEYRKAISTLITAMEIIVDNSSYPREEISYNSHIYRTLGLGYANLGAMLMSLGLPYDSDGGRAYASAVTSILSGQAYNTSAEIAKHMGPFKEYSKNREPMLRVIDKHRAASYNIEKEYLPAPLAEAASGVWDETFDEGKKNGFRNAQVTVLAPTGTIAFMMDCDTTGIEPDIALVKYKKLVGGGVIKIVNNTVEKALKKLGYNSQTVNKIIAYIDENDTIEGAPELKEEHLPVFDCAFKPTNGVRSIHYLGHIKMMAAAHPFISGAISKTVNVPEDITVAEIMDIYVRSWKLGLKAIAIYRDNSKRTQPLSTALKETVKEYGRPYRRRLPDERKAINHKFSIGGHEGYINVGLYEDASPGEIFIVMAKEGSIISGLMDSFATAISMALQYGVPLKVLCNKFTHTRFEPSGFTNNQQIPYAKSIMDYIFRWLAIKFLPKEEKLKYMNVEFTGEPEEEAPIWATTNEINLNNNNAKNSINRIEEREKLVFQTQADAPNCSNCGNMMVRNGNCYKCLECGSTSGCS